jgi:hypothetical protein
MSGAPVCVFVARTVTVFGCRCLYCNNCVDVTGKHPAIDVSMLSVVVLPVCVRQMSSPHLGLSVPCDQTSGFYVVIRDEVLQRDVELICSALTAAVRSAGQYTLSNEFP